MLKGKRLSILGDSISTYKGISNDVKASASICDNPYFYRLPFPQNKTYWSRLAEVFGLIICVNNSWSGGNLSGRDNAASGVNRAQRLARDDGDKPDIIIVFMGINDLGRKVAPEVFACDYELTLSTIAKDHPDADVCCVNIPDRDPVLKERAVLFNSAIENAVKKAGSHFFVADLFGSRLNNDFYYDNTLDGLHPDEDGMKIIADVIEDAIRKRYRNF